MIQAINKITGNLNAATIKVYPELEKIEITPEVEDKTYIPTEYGFEEVTVKGVKAYIDKDIKPEYIKDGVDILGVIGNVVELQGEEKTIIPSTIQQIIVPSDGKNGMTRITVEAVDSSIDENIKPELIREGTEILGVIGEYKGVDTSDATATTNDILVGKTAYVNNEKIEGNIPNNGQLEYQPTETTQIIPMGFTSGGTVLPIDITTLDEYKTCLNLTEIIFGELAEYTRLKYVEVSSQTQYIDTGVQALSNVSAEIVVKVPTADECMFFGAWGNNNGLLFGQAGSHWFGDECYSVATDSAFKNAVGIKFDADWHTYKYDATTGKSSVDGVETEAPANSGRNANIYIFKTNNYGKCTIGTQISRCKLYEDDKLIRDYIPVIRNSDGVVCMYDLIEEKFALNNGTGSFIAGPIAQEVV